jgi:autotransporter-associated beta strand protein
MTMHRLFFQTRLVTSRRGFSQARRDLRRRSSRRPRGPAAPERLEARQVLAALLDGGLSGSLSAATFAATYDVVDASWFWSTAESADGGATLMVASANGTGGAADGPVAAATAATDEWLVRLTRDAVSSLDNLAAVQTFLDPAGLGLRVVAGLGLPGLVLVVDESPAGDIAGALQAHEGVAYLERNAPLTVGAALPNDARFNELWGLHNVGQSGGRVDADIDAPEAWVIETGSRAVAVSVIDTGIDLAHPDLYLNIWINQAEIPPAIRNQVVDVDGDGLVTFVDLNHPANASLVFDSNRNGRIDALDLLADSRWANRQDTDGNGFIDDLFGWDFANNDNNPTDDNFHGTHVAGTIGAIGNNAIGVTGVAWEVSLMGLKFLSGSGSGTTANAVRSVNYATMMRQRGDERVRITNNSWGGGGYSQSLKDAIDAGGRAEILFVAAAGNDAIDADGMPQYPANYRSPSIIAVAATDRTDNLASFSNYGVSSVHLSAPGVAILSTVPGGYATYSGTSMAAPHVAGAAALALAATPGLRLAELKQALLDTVDPVPALAGRTISGGRLNARQVLDGVADPLPEFEFVGGSIPENSPAGTTVGYFAVEPAGAFVFTLVPGAADNASFSLVGNELRSAQVFDFELRNAYGIRVRATTAEGAVLEKTFTIRVTDVNEPPTAVALVNRVSNLPENTSTAQPVRVADIVITDDALGTNQITLGGRDAGVFQVIGSQLFIRAGTPLDHVLTPSYAVTVSVVDPVLGGTPLTASHTVVVTPAATSWTYGFKHVFDANADRHLVENVAMRKYSEILYPPELPRTTYWGPAFNDVEGRLVYRFDLPGNTQAVRLQMAFSSLILGSSRGAFAVDVSRDGTTWVELRNNLEPRNWGDSWSMNGQLPESVLGTSTIFVRMRFYTENFSNITSTIAQFGRSTVVATANVFEIEATLAANASPTDITLTGDPVPENSPPGTLAGRLATVDRDVGDTFRYELVAGEGDAGNPLFAIDGDRLLTTAPLDFEAAATHTVRIRSTDSGGRFVEKVLTVHVADVNEPPTAIRLVDAVTNLPENADTSGPRRLADVVVDDDALGTNVISLSGPDAASFEVSSGQLWLRAGAVLDHATRPRLSVTLAAADPTLPEAAPVTVDYELTVDRVSDRESRIVLSHQRVDENRPVGTIVGLFSRSDELAGSTPLTAVYAAHDGRLWLTNTTPDPLAVESVTITSPARKLSGEEARLPDVPFRSSNLNPAAPFGLHSEIFFSGVGAAAFVLDAGATWEFGLVAEVGLTPADLRDSFETDPDVDDAPGDRPGRFLYSLVAAGPGSFDRGIIVSSGGVFSYELVAGAGDDDNDLFEIDGQSLLTRAVFDYEARSSYSIRVRSTGPGELVVEDRFTIEIGDVNEAPTAVVLTAVRPALPESADTGAPILVAGIEVIDDALGDNVLWLTGADADAFEIIGTGLYLRAGVVLDYGVQQRYDVIVHAADPLAEAAPGLPPDAQAGFALAIENVPEHSGREYIDVAEGVTLVDATVREGSRQLVKRGGGTLVLAAANRHAGGLVVEAGHVVLADAAAAGSGTLDVRSATTLALDIGTSRATLGGLVMAETARIDVGLGGLRIAAGAIDPQALRALLVSGRAGGSWTGPGIGSSAVAATAGRTVGYRVLADGTAFVAWSAFGDANLDGRINSSDINLLLAGGRFGQPGTDAVWSDGDFNYDGVVNSRDLNLLLATGLLNAGPYYPTAGRQLGEAEPATPEMLLAAFGQPGAGSPSYDSPPVGGIANPPRPRPAVDLTGNGIADLVWETADGAAIAWIDGDPATPRLLGGGDGWSLAAIGDFDGDGISDLLWKNAGGGHVVWLMDAGGGTTGQRFLGGDDVWSLEATGDYDGDGRTDLVWRNAVSGANVMWLMHGAEPADQFVVGGDHDWRLVPTEERFDIDGDGRTDLVWRNAVSGGHVAWLMRGGEVAATRALGGEPAWQVVGAGDFDGDGRGDLLWRHAADGGVVMQLLDDGGVRESRVVGGDLSRSPVATRSAVGRMPAAIFWRDLAGGVEIESLSRDPQPARRLASDTAWRLLGRPSHRG